MDDDYEDKTITARNQVLLGDLEHTNAYLVLLAGGNVGEMFRLSGTQILGRSHNVDLRILGDGTSRKHARLITSGNSVLIEDLGSTNGTFVNGERIVQHVLKDGDKIQIGKSIVLKFTYQDNFEEDFQRHMYESASRDALTRVFNKRYFTEQIAVEFSFAQRHGQPLTLLIIDLDRFKNVNDSYGHPAGDFVLSELSRLVSNTVRSEDVFARYGGEEFVILARNTDVQSACQLAERIRKLIAEHVFSYGKHEIKITTSIGVAANSSIDIDISEELIEAADKAMYKAKLNGRNRVEIY